MINIKNKEAQQNNDFAGNYKFITTSFIRFRVILLYLIFSSFFQKFLCKCQCCCFYTDKIQQLKYIQYKPVINK